MYYIYALKCGESVLYVGQTLNMRKRFDQHKRRTDRSGSRNIPIDWYIYIELLRICLNKEEANQQERHYYDILNPSYNCLRPRA